MVHLRVFFRDTDDKIMENGKLKMESENNRGNCKIKHFAVTSVVNN